jgi:dihydroflavonol-4-reductase
MQLKEKVLVTGANGLLGANVTEQLAMKGFHVVAMVRKGCNMKGLHGLVYNLFEGDITNSEDLEKVISRCDYVVHCAARTSQNDRFSEYESTNIFSTQLIIEVCKKFHVKRLVFVSSANCFTNGTLKKPGNEESDFLPWLKQSGYAFSKYIAQTLVLNETKKKSLNAVVVAPTFMIGARDTGNSSGKLLRYAIKNQILFYLPGGKSFVDVGFAAEATANALTNGESGNCYLLAGENLTYKDFFKKVSKLNGTRKLLIPIPKFILILIASLSEPFEKLFHISVPLSKVNQKLLCLNNYFSNKKAVQEIGLKKTNIDDSIIKAISWIKANPNV